MRVLVLANFDVGLYNFRKDLLKDLIEKKNEVYISLPYGEKVELLTELGCKYINTNVDRRSINPLTDVKLIKDYFKLINKIKPDKVITYTIKPNIYAGCVCRMKNIPMYANITGLGTAFQGNGILTKFVTSLYKYAFKKVKTVFFENKENRDIFIGKGIISAEKSYCLNGAGVNLEEYKFTEYPTDDSTIHFLFIGRIMREKGINELLDCATRMHEENINAVIDIIGSFEEDYKEKFAEMEETGIIKYYGYQSNVKPFIERSHCFVLPSYHEGMANTLLECGAMGRPLITSNIHGCLEAVQDGVTGFLCEVKNSDDLYAKMRKFIYLAYDEKCKMGQLSHTYISNKFDKKKVVEETVREIMK